MAIKHRKGKISQIAQKLNRNPDEMIRKMYDDKLSAAEIYDDLFKLTGIKITHRSMVHPALY